MRGTPSCLRRRYEAIDDLVHDLNASAEQPWLDDESMRLMCDFWNILQENPECDLTRAVQQQLGIHPVASQISHPQSFSCYMAGTTTPNDPCEKHRGKRSTPCADKTDNTRECCKHTSKTCGTSSSFSGTRSPDVLPLSKVLVNLKQASSYHKKCNEKVADLLQAESKLQQQIKHLEKREKDGVQLLKEADCMWTCMEEAYKKKIFETLEKQKNFNAQFKEIEASISKWRKNKRDLELELENINKVAKETTEKIGHKSNDLKIMKSEIKDLTQRIEKTNKEIDSAKKSFAPKKLSCDAKIKNINEEIKKLEAEIKEERKRKEAKERDGAKFITDTRNDLTMICKCVLQKRMINEDLKSELNCLEHDIKMLTESHDDCRNKCNLKATNVHAELAKVQNEIDNFKVRCIQCHKCVDTSDTRKCCIDCPRCIQERECHMEGDTCHPDPDNVCVCMSTKQKLLDNVFENMYTVIAKQSKTKAGKVVASSVMACLKRSQNGKLDMETRNMLKSFLLKSIKRNLNLTIVGGAVKTRCEMEPETYNQLMKCLKQVKVVTIPKVDKGTLSKKDPCRRWPAGGECHCAKGPNTCICSRKGPPPLREPGPQAPEKDENANDKVLCPYKEDSECGPECGMQSPDFNKWRPEACKPKTCKFPGANMKAAQCTIPTESLGIPSFEDCCSTLKLPQTSIYDKKYLPQIPTLDRFDTSFCQCGQFPCCCQPERDISKTRKKNLPLILRYKKRCACTQCWMTSEVSLNKRDDDNVANQGVSGNPQESKTDEHTLEEDKKGLKSQNEDTGTVENIDDIEENITNFKEVSKKLVVEGRGIHSNEFCCLLEFTTSNNFKAVFDKEFEIPHRQSIDIFLGGEKMLEVFLKRTDSGNLVFNVDEIKSNKVKNALVIKTPSEEIKIMHDEVKLTHRIPPLKILDVISEGFRKKKHHRTIKAQSDSCLLREMENKLEGKIDIFSKPSAKLQMTSSGQYAIVLSKDSRKNFINDLKRYLIDSKQNRLPIERTDSGEIKIVLAKTNENCLYGSLKVTPSGGIYVIMDKKVLNSMKSEVREDDISGKDQEKYTQAFSKHQNVLDKSITTFCNANTDSISFDSSRCNCNQLRLHSNNEKEYEQTKDKFHGLELLKKTLDDSESFDCFGKQEHCYFSCESEQPMKSLFESSKSMYTTSSNTYLEAAIDLNDKYHDTHTNDPVELNNLNHLPPQLPYFLRTNNQTTS